MPIVVQVKARLMKNHSVGLGKRGNGETSFIVQVEAGLIDILV